MSNTKASAIALRKQGYSYSQITQELRVAKSTLSSWLREVELTPAQQAVLVERRADGGRKGSRSTASVKEQFRRRRQRLLDDARRWVDDHDIVHDRVALIGAALYWAEGAKHRNYLKMSNADPAMIRVYMYWLRHSLQVPEDDIRCHVYGYTDNGYTETDVLQYWSEVTRVPVERFYKTVFVASRGRKKRKNVLPYGVLHVSVQKPQQHKAKYEAIVELMGKESEFV
jgi:hypothetical protein